MFHQYGKAILVGAVSSLAFAAAFGIKADGRKGFIQIAYGKALEGASLSGAADREDADVNLAIAARSVPKVVYAYQKTVPCQAVNLNAMFSAEDAQGNPVKVEITDIFDASGKSVLYQTKEDKLAKRKKQETEEFVFSCIGAYTLCVTAVDAERKAFCGRYQIPVTSN